MDDEFETADDAELLLGTDRDPESFAAFYRRHEQGVLAYFRHRTHQADLVADLTAETFAHALASRRSFDPARGPARGWLFGIASHVLSRSLRKRRVEDRARRKIGLERIEFTESEYERIEVMSVADLLEIALDGIPDNQRRALQLRVVEERTYEDVASQMQSSQVLARQRVRRGLTALRSRLEDPR